MQTWDIVHRSAFSLSCQSNSSNLQYAISIQDTWRVPVIGPFLYFFGTSRNLSLGGKKQTRGERVREKRANKMAVKWMPTVAFGAVASHIFLAYRKKKTPMLTVLAIEYRLKIIMELFSRGRPNPTENCSTKCVWNADMVSSTWGFFWT